MILNTYDLNAKNVDKITDEIYNYCLSLKMDKKLARNYSLNIDSVLLYWLNNSKDKEITLKLGRKYLSERIIVELKDKQLNPYLGDEEYISFQNAILKHSGLKPNYIYTNKINRVEFKLKTQKINPVASLLLLVISSTIIALFLKAIFSELIIDSLLNTLVVPLYNLFFRLVGCIAGPMIFLSVTWGIYGIGDSIALKNVGKVVIKKELLTTFIIVSLSALFFFAFDIKLINKSDSFSSLSQVIDLVLSVVPSTVIEPFVTGNTLQIIFLAMVVGFALIFLESQTQSIAKAIEQLNQLINFFMEFISSLIPFIVVLVVLEIIWNNDYMIFISTWRFILILLIALILATTIIILKASLTYKLNPIVLAKKNYKTFLIALMTASSVAAFFENIKNAQEEFGFDEKFTSFSIPLGMMLHNPMAAIYDLLIIFYFASIYNVEFSISTLILSIIISCFVAISTPPIPGGAMAAYILLFNQIGIPLDALTIVAALDVLTDFFITAFETYAINYSLIDCAAKTNMLNYDILKKY